MTVRTFLYTFFTPWLPILREEGVVPQWALTASLLILVVLLIRVLLRGKISLRACYALWAVVALRLLIPIQLSISLPVAPAQLVEEMPYELTYPTVPMYPSAPVRGAVSSSMHYSSDDHTQAIFTQTMPDGEQISVTVPIWSRYQRMLLGWWGGVLVIMGAVVVSNLHFTRKLKKRRTLLGTEDCPLPVYVAEGLPSPCLFGIVRPCIYLTPEAAADETIRRHVLAHELTHYAHKDHLWSVVRCLCLALHWYNPLVWLAATLSKRDGELACDEGAVGRLGEEERIPYGRTLVGLVARRSPGDMFSCSTAMTGGKKTVQQRIELLVKRPQAIKTALFAAVAILALCLVFVFASGSSQSDEYELFLEGIEEAQSIQVGTPIVSSQIYPYPIADEDLLRQAKSLLLSAQRVDPEMTEISQGFGDHIWDFSIIFIDGSDEIRYILHSTDQAVYIAEDSSYTIEDLQVSFTPFAYLPQDTRDILEKLARGQYDRALDQQTSIEAPNGPYYWGKDVDYDPDPSQPWDTNLTATITRMPGVMIHTGIEIAGQPGGLATLSIGPEGVTCTLSDAAGHDLDVFGKTINALATVEPNELSSWFQVTKYGQCVPGSFTFHDTPHGFVFSYDFDEPCPLEIGEQLVTRIGPSPTANTLNWMSILRPEDIRADQLSGSISPEELARAIRAAAEHPVNTPSDSTSFIRYSLWQLSLPLSDNAIVTLCAGLTEDIVEVGFAGDCFYAPELYAMIRGLYTPSPGDVVQADLAPVRSAVDQLLANELMEANAYPPYGLYSGVELTAFRKLAEYDDLVKDAKVGLYYFDFGLATDDLAQAGWAGGNYADGNGLFHPYEHRLHLLTLERGGTVERYYTFGWETVLKPGGYDFTGDVFTADRIKNIVIDNIRDLIDPVVPASFNGSQQAADEYGRLLAQAYLSLDAGHPNAVTYARFVSASLYEQSNNGLCASITLELDPVDPITVYWMAGSGIDWDEQSGHWRHTLEYRLDHLSDGTWRCTSRGTGGVRLD